MSEVNNRDKEIIRTWIAGTGSCNIIIPKNFAKIFGFDKPSHATVEISEDGNSLLIKRLEV